jgi:hypothetical protein
VTIDGDVVNAASPIIFEREQGERMAETIKLDKREFQVVDHALTASQDFYILAHIQSSGAIEVMYDTDGKKRSDRGRSRLVANRLDLSGETFAILAGCLTEVGKKWTRAEAERNAEIFAEITDKEEKRVMRSILTTLVNAFFEQEGKSQRTSPRSSSQSETGLRTGNEAESTSEITRQ